MAADIVAIAIVLLSLGAFAHHHFLFPAILSWAASRRRWNKAAGAIGSEPTPTFELPSVTVIVPAYNEERFIAEKVRNLAAVEYPRERLKILIALDGCTDATAERANQALEAMGRPDHITLVVHPNNRGKLAVINEAIAAAESEIVALSDVSAMLSPDALARATRHFADPTIGVVCPTYRLSRPGSAGEAAYWTYQTRLKANEARLAAPMGAHGAFYLFRRNAWTPLPAGTINDDFVLPMRIVARGLRAVYDESVVAIEMEETKSEQEFSRRVRIGAGNVQQLVWLANLADPRNGWLSFVFLSGKALRPIVPAIAVIGLACTAYLASRGYLLFEIALVAAVIVLAVAIDAIVRRPSNPLKAVAWLAYLVEGYAASLLGALKYMVMPRDVAWSRTEGNQEIEECYAPWSVRFGKRALDLVCVAVTLIFLAIFFIPIALAIKLDSRGPIFYRQQRVGYCRPNVTRLFHVIKFRTMREDAEAMSGAVWASEHDPRITRVGRVLRKTRIDELPQVFNVLAGDMSFVGPRPERPKLVANLEKQIPFYLERNFYMLPGITGLAQVNQGYDNSIEDVRSKVMFDHAYAARLSSFRSWLIADVGILLSTLRVMILGRGR